MPAKVMKVISAKQHPNADTLRIYEMNIDHDKPAVTIIANPTNVYEVGDSVIVALCGSVLKDDTKIKETKIRGVSSGGMALGKTDLPIGTDVSNEYCQEITDGSGQSQMIRWPDIESLFNVRKSLAASETLRKVNYIAKIKLDGTNGGIQILPSGEIVVQSRGQIITPENDNVGFARWVEDNKEYFSNINAGEHITIFGEWCGAGIQKRCAISQIDRKVFCVFAIQYETESGPVLDINPFTIKRKLNEHNDVFVLPFFGNKFQLDFADTELLKQQTQIINDMVSEVEKCDPFVKSTFNIEGLGEGVVLYPLSSDFNTLESVVKSPIENESKIIINRTDYVELVFKAKGEEHKVVKTKEAAQIDPEVAKNIDEFVNLLVTTNRLEQIAQKVGSFDMKSTGQFLKEFCMDVQKESKAELEASNMTWKQVSDKVSTAARKWWLDKCKEI